MMMSNEFYVTFYVFATYFLLIQQFFFLFFFWITVNLASQRESFLTNSETLFSMHIAHIVCNDAYEYVAQSDLFKPD